MKEEEKVQEKKPLSQQVSLEVSNQRPETVGGFQKAKRALRFIWDKKYYLLGAALILPIGKGLQGFFSDNNTKDYNPSLQPKSSGGNDLVCECKEKYCKVNLRYCNHKEPNFYQGAQVLVECEDIKGDLVSELLYGKKQKVVKTTICTNLKKDQNIWILDTSPEFSKKDNEHICQEADREVGKDEKICIYNGIE